MDNTTISREQNSSDRADTKKRRTPRKKRREHKNNNNKGGGEIKAEKLEWGKEEWKLTIEGTNLRGDKLEITQTIDIKEGVVEISKWIRNEDITETRLPLWKEMGGEFSEKQQSMC